MKFPVLFLLLLLATSCVDELGTDVVVDNPTKHEDCEGDLLCTDEFVFFGVTLVNGDGESIELESDKVSAFYTDSEEGIEVDISDFGGTTQYFIASDNDLDKIDFAGTSITFEARVSKFKTVRREFIVAKDCCHIYNPEGQNQEIVVD